MTIAKPISSLTERDQERFWSKVDRSDPHVCWLWRATTTRTGYGQFWWSRSYVLAHRVAYVLDRGSLPTFRTVDHLCRNRACVNPAHLEAVTGQENTLRGEGVTAQQARRTHCPKGHEYTSFKEKGRTGGHRRCVVCLRDQGRIRMRKQRGAERKGCER